MKYTRNEELETNRDRENFIGKIFKTNKCGEIKILGVYDSVGKNKRYIVEFIDNGHQQLTYKTQILKGKVKNNSLLHPKIGKIYKTNKCGKCEVLDVYAGKDGKRQKAKVRFLDTKYEDVFFLANIERGEVQDPYAKTLYGVGYWGNLSFNIKDCDFICNRWHDMIQRVYENGGHINYKNVSVDIRWHCLQCFYEDFIRLKGYEWFINNPNIRFDIDKDIIGNGKLYSLDSCILIPHDINMLFAFEQENNSTGYAGVSIDNARDCYQVGLSIEGKRKSLGRFSSLKDGYKAYKEAKMKYCDEILSKYDFINNKMKDKIRYSLENQLMEVLNV